MTSVTRSAGAAAAVASEADALGGNGGVGGDEHSTFAVAPLTFGAFATAKASAEERVSSAALVSDTCMKAGCSENQCFKNSDSRSDRGNANSGNSVAKC